MIYRLNWLLTDIVTFGRLSSLENKFYNGYKSPTDHNRKLKCWVMLVSEVPWSAYIPLGKLNEECWCVIDFYVDFCQFLLEK